MTNNKIRYTPWQQKQVAAEKPYTVT